MRFHLKKNGTDYIIAVHIADVSAFVKTGLTFREELERTTFVYLAEGYSDVAKKTRMTL